MTLQNPTQNNVTWGFCYEMEMPDGEMRSTTKVENYIDFGFHFNWFSI